MPFSYLSFFTNLLSCTKWRHGPCITSMRVFSCSTQINQFQSLIYRKSIPVVEHSGNYASVHTLWWISEALYTCFALRDLYVMAWCLVFLRFLDGTFLHQFTLGNVTQFGLVVVPWYWYSFWYSAFWLGLAKEKVFINIHLFIFWKTFSGSDVSEVLDFGWLLDLMIVFNYASKFLILISLILNLFLCFYGDAAFMGIVLS